MGVFQDVDNSKIDSFFTQMFVSDVTMPHTHDYLSPITFCQFLDRNQIRTFDPKSIYEEACKRWKFFSTIHPQVFDDSPRKEVDLETAERPAENSWHILIDFFRRVLYVAKIKDLYFTMHYLAHVCRAFLDDTAAKLSPRDMVFTRAVFTQIVGGILYDSIVPTQYYFLPVKHYTDASYPGALQQTIIKVQTYIVGHTAQTMEIKKLDEIRSDIIKRELHSALSDLVKHKRNDHRVQSTMLKLTNSMKIYKIDQDAFELSDTMLRDGVKSAIAIDRLSKLGDKFSEGKISSDPDELIDRLLDVWCIVSPPKKESVISKIGHFFKKPPSEEMNNDIDAIKRTRKLDPS